MTTISLYFSSPKQHSLTTPIIWPWTFTFLLHGACWQLNYSASYHRHWATMFKGMQLEYLPCLWKAMKDWIMDNVSFVYWPCRSWQNMSNIALTTTPLENHGLIIMLSSHMIFVMLWIRKLVWSTSATRTSQLTLGSTWMQIPKLIFSSNRSHSTLNHLTSNLLLTSRLHTKEN